MTGRTWYGRTDVAGVGVELVDVTTAPPPLPGLVKLAIDDGTRHGRKAAYLDHDRALELGRSLLEWCALEKSR